MVESQLFLCSSLSRLRSHRSPCRQDSSPSAPAGRGRGAVESGSWQPWYRRCHRPSARGCTIHPEEQAGWLPFYCLPLSDILANFFFPYFFLPMNAASPEGFFAPRRASFERSRENREVMPRALTIPVAIQSRQLTAIPTAIYVTISPASHGRTLETP